ncbi:hypothetical protein Cni_G01193 [Canna indica]|uniref:Bifunctional inhibitor/plant lipid transfer protein/seed storage helical domain-containing protein n=1 Tax=Canna indica TaxID=4628 RepID=A0AAQ3JMU9_9LILI|nr:hypothetical protein Cni_G01193 [Canna indica]
MAANALAGLPFFLALTLVAVGFHGASGDTSSDITECGSQLIGMQTCLGFVQGAAKAPTPDCCSGLKGVLTKSPKCLCILIKDRDDPQLPIKINVTRALALPADCGAPANISACPQILHLLPNSKEAQIFKQSGSTSQAKGNSSISSGGSGDAQRSGSSKNHLGFRSEIVAGFIFYVMQLLLFT